MTDHNERVYGLNQQQPLPCNAGGDSEQDDDDAIDAALIDHDEESIDATLVEDDDAIVDTMWGFTLVELLVVSRPDA